MRTYKRFSHGEIRKILCWYPLLSVAVNEVIHLFEFAPSTMSVMSGNFQREVEQD